MNCQGALRVSRKSPSPDHSVPGLSLKQNPPPGTHEHQPFLSKHLPYTPILPSRATSQHAPRSSCVSLPLPAAQLPSALPNGLGINAQKLWLAFANKSTTMIPCQQEGTPTCRSRSGRALCDTSAQCTLQETEGKPLTPTEIGERQPQGLCFSPWATVCSLP